MKFTRKLALSTAFVTAATLGAWGTALADKEKEAAQALVDKSVTTFNNFVADPDMTWFKNNVGNATGIMIIPTQLKGGFIVGGQAGTGAMLARDPKSGLWSMPSFYGMGGASIGLQIGGEASEVVLLVMSERGLNAFLSNNFELGADVRVAAGPVGAGAKAATADVFAFSRSKGLFGGVSAEGSIIGIRDKTNSAYSGRSVTATDILVRRNVKNDGATKLIKAVAAGAAK